MKIKTFTLIVLGILCMASISAQDSAEELAKKLANPVASLISAPFQSNMDIGIGDLNGSRYTLNIQPVVPFGITENLNLITRVIAPVISQTNITGLGNTETGLGDFVLSAFLSPVDTKSGLIWGAGPALLLPTGTDDFLTTKKFGVGPTAVALYQTNGFTFGGLVNQIWSVAGDEDRADVNLLFFQPFLVYNWKSGAGIGGNAEITQNWEGSSTTVWINPTVSGITSLGTQKLQFAVGPRFNVAAPDGGKSDFGIRAVLIFLFPK